ncbi:hypothetical protein COCCU_02610 [Corynebacterium occultum]|uniref:Uncharacterized protein n=1 Tax=Corynebacterium occultum TaxID=2675219 RepID=A0A6B8W6F0_9CORY|nr:hypothetical protein [Corynebacterium occultum]QGU06476.1 hypothetical protein COCCU_02610 [Corynebacterium occultum]
MSEISLDITAARSALREMSEETDIQRHRHAARTPDFPVSAAGAGFASHGVRLRDMLTRLHDLGSERLDAVAVTTIAASRQVEVYHVTDEDFGVELGAQA